MKRRFKTTKEFMDFLDKKHADYLKNTEQGRKEAKSYREFIIKNEIERRKKQNNKLIILEGFLNAGYSLEQAEMIIKNFKEIPLPPLITIKPPPFKQKFFLNWPDPVGQVRL